MKRLLFVAGAVLSCAIAGAINPPDKVFTFYNGVNQLEKASSFDEANLIQQHMAGCFMASESSGINLKIDDMDEMSSNFYTMRLYSMLYSERSLKAVCNIIKTEIVEQPDQNKNMQQRGAQHYVTYVTKTYTRNGTAKTYNDAVFTLINGGYITEITNIEPSGKTSQGAGGSVQQQSIKQQKPEQLGIEQLRARAAYCYSKGMYTDAYDYYEQLVARAPEDGDACYRIALLTFWRKGCKHKFSRKQDAEKKAKEYIRSAIMYGNYEIRSKATNVSNNWENDNVYF